jgi:hypothetical protein
LVLRAAIAIAIGSAIVASAVWAQQRGGFNPSAMSRNALAEAFKGITTDGVPQRGLFQLRKTGVPTGPVVDAARGFLASLTADQRKQVSYPVDHDEWRNWANIHRFPREGLSLSEMSEEQRRAAYELLRAGLSAKGYKTSRDIMRLNHHLAELVEDFDAYGEHLYWFIVFGDPSADKPWGWQIEGHHLIVNYLVVGDQIVMTPTFMGSEPVTANSGKYEGVSVFQDEQNLGLRFMQSLPSEHQQAARIGNKDGRSENLSEMFKDNITVPFQGIAAGALSQAHRQQLMKLVGLYVGNLRDAHAAVKLEEVRAHLEGTYFAWKGEAAADAVFYYRIHSPVILIEFDHQGPIALEGSRGTPTRRHVHTVVRTPNGNDYGKDLLRQHYEKFKGAPDHGHQGR